MRKLFFSLFIIVYFLLTGFRNRDTASVGLETLTHSVNSIDKEKQIYQKIVIAKREIEDLVATNRKLSGKYGIIIQSCDDTSSQHTTIIKHYPNDYFKPASNLKLITSAAALEVLPTTFCSETRLYTNGVIENNILNGDLIISGSADPILSGQFDKEIDKVLHIWLQTIFDLGIFHITGEVILDNSFYWSNENKNKEIKRTPIKFSTVANYRNASANQVMRFARKRFVVQKNGKKALTYYVKNKLRLTTFQPNEYFTQLLMNELTKRDIIEKKEIALLTDLPDYNSWSLLYIHKSKPLKEVLKTINTYSDNFFADQVLRTIGYAVSGEGTINAGAKYVKEFLATKVKCDTNRIVIVDGSGLSHANMISPVVLTDVLMYMFHSQSYGVYYNSLAIPHEEGTLIGRIVHPLAENVHAKTGTIGGVLSLSGYITSTSGKKFCFVIINNQAGRSKRSHRTIKGIQDSMCKKILEI